MDIQLAAVQVYQQPAWGREVSPIFSCHANEIQQGHVTIPSI